MLHAVPCLRLCPSNSNSLLQSRETERRKKNVELLLNDLYALYYSQNKVNDAEFYIGILGNSV